MSSGSLPNSSSVALSGFAHGVRCCLVLLPPVAVSVKCLCPGVGMWLPKDGCYGTWVLGVQPGLGKEEMNEPINC